MAFAERELNAIKTDLFSLRKDFGDLLETVGIGGKHSARNAIKTIRRESEKKIDYVKDSFIEHPIISSVVAAGVGLIIGKFIFNALKKD